MYKAFSKKITTALTTLALIVVPSVYAVGASDTESKALNEQTELEILRQRIETLERKLNKQAVDDGAAKTADENKPIEAPIKAPVKDPIRVHGAVRFQYSFEEYSVGNENRGGDIDFDIFRLNFDGEIGDVILSAEYRWFQYQEALKSAYLAYNLDENWQAQVGILKIPFGNMPYNSHSFFFNSTFYIGLEDEHDAGIKLLYRSDDWDLDFAFLKSDEQGGVDGYVSDRTARYNYDTVGIRLVDEGIYDEPTLAVGESNSWAIRLAHKWQLAESESLEVGLSTQGGGLYAGDLSDSPYARFSNDEIGTRTSNGIHANYDNGPLNVQLTYATYDYDLEVENKGAVVAAYAFYDTIPTQATIYTGNVAYTLGAKIGPVTSLTFYNDYSLITDKEGVSGDTWMNVLGMSVAAGGMFTYVDFVSAKNQPFIGGTIAGESDETKHRFNVNFGFYF